tara:strand:+ start:132 stop:743 length:612 start_codon:yes stop_codon:yes gene_type:complete
MINYDLYPLFAVPVLKVNEPYNMSDSERKIIENLEWSDNTNNLISKNHNVLTTVNELSGLRSYISKWLNFYTKEIMKIKDVEFYITQSWCNVTRKSESHHLHYHPNSIVSGVFHFDDDLSSIAFERGHRSNFNLKLNYSEYNIQNCDEYNFSTDKNTLLLFPSKLPHKVKTNNESKDRYSMSFNTFVKGTMGDEHESDLLYLT